LFGFFQSKLRWFLVNCFCLKLLNLSEIRISFNISIESEFNWLNVRKLNDAFGWEIEFDLSIKQESK
jgi:hypothetical protein